MMREDSTFENTAWVMDQLFFSEGNLANIFRAILKAREWICSHLRNLHNLTQTTVLIPVINGAFLPFQLCFLFIISLCSLPSAHCLNSQYLNSH